MNNKRPPAIFRERSLRLRSSGADLSGRLPVQASKATVKIGNRLKAAFVRDLGDGKIGLSEQHDRVATAKHLYVCHHAHARRLAEEVRQMTAADADGIGG